jgi:hypothetical protein
MGCCCWEADDNTSACRFDTDRGSSALTVRSRLRQDVAERRARAELELLGVVARVGRAGSVTERRVVAARQRRLDELDDITARLSGVADAEAAAAAHALLARWDAGIPAEDDRRIESALPAR